MNIEAGQEIGICFSLAIFPNDVRINWPDIAHEDKPNTWQEFAIK